MLKRAILTVVIAIACSTSAAADETRTIWTSPDQTFTLIEPAGWQRSGGERDAASGAELFEWWRAPSISGTEAECRLMSPSRYDTGFGQPAINERLAAQSFESLSGGEAVLQRHAFSNSERNGVQVAIVEFDRRRDDGVVVRASYLYFAVATEKGETAYALLCTVAQPQSRADELATVHAVQQSLAFRGDLIRTVDRAEITPEQHEQLVSHVGEYLERAQAVYARNMQVVPGTRDRIVALSLGGDDRSQMIVAQDMIYKFIGACDDDCTNLDLELIDEDGRLIASDTDPDDFPVVTIRTTFSAPLTVRLIVRACSTEPCYAGWRVLQRQP